MYKLSLLGLLSHPIFWIWSHCTGMNNFPHCEDAYFMCCVTLRIDISAGGFSCRILIFRFLSHDIVLLWDTLRAAWHIIKIAPYASWRNATQRMETHRYWTDSEGSHVPTYLRYVLPSLCCFCRYRWPSSDWYTRLPARRPSTARNRMIAKKGNAVSEQRNISTIARYSQRLRIW